jgi:hypothetical protein
LPNKKAKRAKKSQVWPPRSGLVILLDTQSQKMLSSRGRRRFCAATNSERLFRSSAFRPEVLLCVCVCACEGIREATSERVSEPGPVCRYDCTDLGQQSARKLRSRRTKTKLPNQSRFGTLQSDDGKVSELFGQQTNDVR